jgi:hypothetical protein
MISTPALAFNSVLSRSESIHNLCKFSSTPGASNKQIPQVNIVEIGESFTSISHNSLFCDQENKKLSTTTAVIHFLSARWNALIIVVARTELVKPASIAPVRLPEVLVLLAVDVI